MRLLHIIPILFFTLAWGTGFSQVTADISEVDFGEINRSTDRVIDITLTNSGDQPAFLLRYGFPPEYLVIMSDKTIPPGGTATLRVKFNPQLKGSIKDPVDLWFSNMDKPVHLVFEANVLYIDHTDNPACPSFNERPANCCNDEPALVEVFDRSNGKPISGARVRIIQQGTLQQTMIMDRQGSHELDAPIAYYYLIADAREYFPTDTAMYINRRNNHIRLLLDPAPKTTEVETLAVQDPEQPEAPDDVVEEVTIRIEKEDQPTTDPNPPPLPLNEDANLPESRYSRNNVVILVDVSQSMNQG
ncbi:MAG: DUF1573 domain-containing protein, partial [Calditrichaeota bacterium]|nr:DUF1573 domain-containing protein [Calditrichota bacterium]